jgi:hypothetical protein
VNRVLASAGGVSVTSSPPRLSPSQAAL